jgi:hypothetical protein
MQKDNTTDDGEYVLYIDCNILLSNSSKAAREKNIWSHLSGVF